MTTGEFAILAIISIVAFSVGYAHVRRSPYRTRAASRLTTSTDDRREPDLSRVFFGAPLKVVGVFLVVLFVVGLGNGVRGSGVAGAIGAGFATAIVYGCGVSLIAVPVAVGGGLLALIASSKRKRAPAPRSRHPAAPLE